jgi:hypothetical protein
MALAALQFSGLNLRAVGSFPARSIKAGQIRDSLHRSMGHGDGLGKLILAPIGAGGSKCIAHATPRSRFTSPPTFEISPDALIVQHLTGSRLKVLFCWGLAYKTQVSTTESRI